MTVVSERQTNRVDRQVYDIKNDASTAGASIGDVLNNVPSVNVDPNGTVRLRGSERVTVLVDGKPTAQLQGDNRAAAINALPAENYESVQVINNPGAEFGNEAGGGPILNLISRRYTKPGGNGSVAGTIGPSGRHNAFANGSYSSGYASVNGTLNVRRDGNDTDTDEVRDRIDPVTEADQPPAPGSAIATASTPSSRPAWAAATTTTKPTPSPASVSFSKRGNDASQNEHFTDFGTGQTPVVDYLTPPQDRRRRPQPRVRDRLGAPLRRPTASTLKVDLRHSSNNNTNDTATVYQAMLMPATGAPTLRNYAQDADTRVRMTDLSTDYTGPVGARLADGRRTLAATSQTFDNRYLFLGQRQPRHQAQQPVRAGPGPCWPPTARMRCRSTSCGRSRAACASSTPTST